MSYFAHLALAGFLAVSLVPAAQARSAGHYSATAAATVVATANAPTAQAPGRAADRIALNVAPSQPQPQPQYANESNEDDDGYLG